MIAPSTALRLFFLLAAAAILVINQLPFLRNRFINYGSREAAPPDKSSDHHAYQEKEVKLSDATNAALDAIARFRVPHAWFYHFYALSLVASCIWAQQILSHGAPFELLATAESDARRSSMSLNQVFIAWSLLLFQAGRRLYECVDSYKPSNSSMWIGHWLVGLAFYAAMSLAIWIEASPLMESKPGLQSVRIDPTSLKTLVALPIFALASGLQYDVHTHLASLKKYSMPRHPAFTICICPHYLAECCIYASLAIVAAPRGQIFNWTVASGLVFVAVNLGVTAKGTRQWYARKFKDERIMLKPCMIPGVI